MKGIILRYSAILLVGELFSWWLFFYSPFSIPTHIPNTPINISGLLLLILLIFVIYFFQRKALRFNQRLSFFTLVWMGGLVAFVSECIFQTIRFPTLAAESIQEKFFYGGRGVVVITILALVISTISAASIKVKRKLV